MPNPWDHLPNAKYIDTIIASEEEYPTEWEANWNEAWHNAWDAAWDEVQNTLRDAIWHANSIAARSAMMALTAYDDCAYMLESEPGELAILAAFGDQRAVLLLPACTALATIKEKENVL